MLNFGYVDPSLYQGNLITASVNAGQSSWLVDAITLSAGSASITQSMLFGSCQLRDSEYPKANRKTDTGGSDCMMADPTFVANFWSQVYGATNELGTGYIHATHPFRSWKLVLEWASLITYSGRHSMLGISVIVSPLISSA